MPLRLDPTTIREALGARPDPHAVACIRFDVLTAVHRLEYGIRVGSLPQRQLVHGRPLADWLHLDVVARLLRLAKDDGEEVRTPRTGPRHPGHADE